MVSVDQIRGFAAVLLLAAVLGCQSNTARLMGKWKAVPVKTISSPNLGDVSRSAMLSLATQNLEIEFNKEGKFKFGAGIGAGTGSYRWSEGDLVLTFDTFGPQREMRFRFQGDELVEKTEFESDVKIRFKKSRN